MTQFRSNIEYTGSKPRDVVQDLIEENNFLLKIVDTIPAKIYFDQEVQEKLTSEKHFIMDKKAEDLKKKSSNHAELSAKTKHKRARVDPLCQKSVSQIHQELGNIKQRNKKKVRLLTSASLTRAENIEELQKRLQERINEFQVKRKGTPNSDPKKKTLKYKEKKMKQKKVVLNKIKESEMQTKKDSQQKSEKNTNTQPKYNKEGKIIYSKLDFSENGIEDKTGKNGPTGKQYKVLLKKAEKKKEKLENLKNTDPEKAVTFEEKEKWKKAILLSENVKVKDDTDLLKKSIKRQEKLKKKSAKTWKGIKEHTEEKKKKRQEKRMKNINKRKTEKLQHKIKHAKKKGRVIPGF